MLTRSPSRALAPLSTLLLPALALLGRPAPAHACGGMIFPDHETRVGGMSDQELVVFFGADETVLVASAGYKGIDADNFGFVLPLASEPAQVLDADPSLLLALDEYSAPRVSVIVDDGDDAPSLCAGDARSGGLKNDLGGGAMGDGTDVMIHQRGRTATYEWVVIGGDTGTAIADWLTSAGYPLPADYDAALAPYVADDWYFFAAKVTADAADGTLAPIELHLPPSQPNAFRIPLGLAAHSLTPDDQLGLTTYILAGGPVLTGNYPSAVVDGDELVATSPSETNYAELEAAIMGSDPGGAWVIDYSNPLYAVDLGYAYNGGVEEGRVDPETSDPAFIADFADRLGFDEVYLTRLRTRLPKANLRDLELRTVIGPPANNYYSATYSESRPSGMCAVDRRGRLAQFLLLVPVLLWIRRKPRRSV